MGHPPPPISVLPPCPLPLIPLPFPPSSLSFLFLFPSGIPPLPVLPLSVHSCSFISSFSLCSVLVIVSKCLFTFSKFAAIFSFSSLSFFSFSSASFHVFFHRFNCSYGLLCTGDIHMDNLP